MFGETFNLVARIELPLFLEYWKIFAEFFQQQKRLEKWRQDPFFDKKLNTMYI